jgi:lipopolysaccharide/colanic/teichoic acid biosynthesis glycosyltransferase
MTAGDRGIARRFAKRLLDLAIAAAALVLLAPILLVAAVAIFLADGRPILFRQLRPGREGHPFRLCKFRTMSSEPVADNEPRPDAERLTRLGRILRITSLDELPTLWNVLVGEMSLVGPRPLLMEYLPLYSPEQSRRHAIRPGITGWAQVNGRNAISWEQKFAYDVWYVDHWTLGLDLQILARTFVNVLRAEGINQSGQATMEKFRGSAR